jgi:hypothetical protein
VLWHGCWLLQGPRQRLVLLAAAKNAGVSIELMEARLQVLTMAWYSHVRSVAVFVVLGFSTYH